MIASAHPGECRDPDHMAEIASSSSHDLAAPSSVIWIPAFAGTSGGGTQA